MYSGVDPLFPFVHLWFVHMTVRWDGEKWEQGNKKKETAGISFYPCFYALFVLSTQTLLLYYLLQRQEKVLSFIAAPLNSVHFTMQPHFIHVCCMHNILSFSWVYFVSWYIFPVFLEYYMIKEYYRKYFVFTSYTLFRTTEQVMFLKWWKWKEVI